MALPTPQDCRDYLEGYNITESVMSDAWITRAIERVLSQVGGWLKLDLTAATVKEYEEYVSGTGSNVLMLSRRPVIDIVTIQYVNALSMGFTISLTALEVIKETGVLRSRTNWGDDVTRPLFFRGTKNIRVVYHAGWTVDTFPADLFEAIVMLTCEVMLGQIGGRTGGGDLTMQQFGRQYGDRGKYTQPRQDLKRQAMAILRNYMTGVVTA